MGFRLYPITDESKLRHGVMVPVMAPSALAKWATRS